MRSKAIILTLLWLAALAGSMAFLDQPVKQWLYDHRFHDPAAGIMKATPWAQVMRAMGYYPTVIAIVAGLVCLAKLPWCKGLVALVCAATSIVNDPLKWIVGRSRPILRDGTLERALDFVPLSTRASGNAFPSGHAMLAFATAAVLGRYYSRWSWLWYFLAMVVAAERVLEMAHHVSDVIGAAGLGIILSVWLAPPLERWLNPPPLAASVAAEPEQKVND